MVSATQVHPTSTKEVVACNARFSTLQVFMKFALYKLYSLQNLVYPPTINKQLDDGGACLLAVQAGEHETVAADNNQEVVAASVKGKLSSAIADSTRNGSNGGGDGDRKKGLSYAKSNDDMSSKLATLGAS